MFIESPGFVEAPAVPEVPVLPEKTVEEKAREIVQGALELIEHGWTTGLTKFFQNYCMVGALGEASGLGHEVYYSRWKWTPELRLAVNTATNCLPGGWNNLDAFNDYQRSSRKPQKVFRKAIKKLS